MFDKNLDPNNIDVLFLDEVQVRPNIIYVTKLFLKSKVKLICSGSLLGLQVLNKASKTDVGSKIYLDVYPLDFKEFLLWSNRQLLVEEIQKCFDYMQQIHPSIHKLLLELFDNYLIVGGMPKAVAKYVDNDCKISNDIYNIKNAIIRDYISDNHDIYNINDEYTKTNIKIANIVYEKIDNFIINPSNKKFVISNINKNYKYRNIMVPLDLLKRTNIVFASNNVSAIQYPLSLHLIDSSFKLYYNDIGLLTQKLKLNDVSLFNWQSNKEISSIMGGIIESAVIINMRKKELYYWTKSINGTFYEIDLLIEDSNTLDIYPVEIKSKSGEHTKSKSLKVYIDNYNPKKIYCIGPNNFLNSENKYFIPYYASYLLK